MIAQFYGAIFRAIAAVQLCRYFRHAVLVANCVIFHNVFSLSRVLHDLQREGYPLQAREVAALSPYVTQHLNRFGRYDLDMEKRPPELVCDLWT